MVHPTAEDVRRAAHFKGRYRVAYVDAFAVVPAVAYRAPVVTGDPDFLTLERDGLIAVEWMGL